MPSSVASEGSDRILASVLARQRRDDDFRPVYPAGQGPRSDERALLSRRTQDLAGWLGERIAGDDPGLAEIFERIDALRSRRMDDREKAADLDNLMTALGGASRAALTQAMVEVLQGRAGIDPRYPPTPPQIRVLADRIERTWRLEKQAIETALAVPEAVPRIEATLSPEKKAELDRKIEAIRRRVAAKGRAAVLPERPDPETPTSEASSSRRAAAMRTVAAECEARRLDREAGLGVPLPS